MRFLAVLPSGFCIKTQHVKGLAQIVNYMLKTTFKTPLKAPSFNFEFLSLFVVFLHMLILKNKQ
jgi:hypothetical protein